MTRIDELSLTDPEVLAMKRLDRLKKYEQECLELRGRVLELTKALGVLHVALNDGEGGSYHPAREFLDERGIYNGDLNDLRVLDAVVKCALEARK